MQRAASTATDCVLWGAGKDREILHAATASAGELTADACLAILARTPNPDESWPVPRTERQVRARGDWLGARLAGMAQGGAQGV